MKTFLRILVGLWVMLFIVFLAWQLIVQQPKAITAEKELVQEFNKITPPNGVKQLSYNSRHKTSQALVGAKYQSTLKYDDLLVYYKKELSKHGWQYYNEETVIDSGQDLGGKAVKYTKGNYKLTLQYAGDQANYNWDYSIDLSWGLK